MVRSSVCRFRLTAPDPTFFPGHAAAIHVRIGGKEHVIGAFGVLHPTVLEKFELRSVMRMLVTGH